MRWRGTREGPGKFTGLGRVRSPDTMSGISNPRVPSFTISYNLNFYILISTYHVGKMKRRVGYNGKKSQFSNPRTESIRCFRVVDGIVVHYILANMEWTLYCITDGDHEKYIPSCRFVSFIDRIQYICINDVWGTDIYQCSESNISVDGGITDVPQEILQLEILKVRMS